MNRIGKLRAAFMIEGRGMAITTDREASVPDAMRFRRGDRLVLKDTQGNTCDLTVSSAELALSTDRKDYLSFLLAQRGERSFTLRSSLSSSVFSLYRFGCSIC